MTVPGTGPVHLVAVDDGTASAHAGRHDARRRGPLDHRHRTEDPLGARDDARSRVRGRPGRSRRASIDATTASSSSRCTTPRRARRRSTSSRRAKPCSRSAMPGETIAIRQRRAPVQDVVFAAGRGAGLRLAHVPRRRGRGPATAVSAGGTVLANEHVPRRGRSERRHAHDRRRRRARHRRQPPGRRW